MFGRYKRRRCGAFLRSAKGMTGRGRYWTSGTAFGMTAFSKIPCGAGSRSGSGRDMDMEGAILILGDLGPECGSNDIQNGFAAPIGFKRTGQRSLR